MVSIYLHINEPYFQQFSKTFWIANGQNITMIKFDNARLNAKHCELLDCQSASKPIASNTIKFPEIPIANISQYINGLNLSSNDVE